MSFLDEITNLTNWMGNVIMPTVAGLFFALAVVGYSRGYPHQYIAWSGLMCLMVSGLLRGLETFTSAISGLGTTPTPFGSPLREE